MSSITEKYPEAKQPAPEPATASLARLRIWPAAAILALLWISQLAPRIFPDAGSVIFMVLAFGPMAAALAISLWWLFASRAAWSERLLGLAGLIAVAAVSLLLLDTSMRNFIVIAMFILPWGLTAFAGALILLHAMRSGWRTVLAVLAAAIGFGGWNTLQYEGMQGSFKSDFAWRWKTTSEERYLTNLSGLPDQPPAADPALENEPLVAPEWPGFRGPNRDAVVPGMELETDWQAHPPEQLWQRLIGPGWSSFAVAGRRLYTQEQRGEDEAVLCLDAATGAERWVYQYPARFFESMAGAGPRATPTLAEGRLFTLGATGILHCLDALSGDALWKRELKTDAGRDPPMWGFSSSPLVVGEVVLVHGGKDDKGVLAYDVQTGEPRWSVAAGDHTYGSPHLVEIAGKPIVLMHSNVGLHAIDPEQGKSLGTVDAKIPSYASLQPLLLDEQNVLLGMGMDDGARRFNVSLGGELEAEEQWTSRDMKSGFNDAVAHEGYLYGFDRDIFACIDLETGERQWKKGRYGAGQVLLLPDADQLLVLSETGDVVLLRATPEKLDELARYKAIEGKTWNHPALAGARLYVRNGEQAACLELPLRGSEASSGEEIRTGE